MASITPFLWFDGDAEAAVTFYKSVFKGTKIRDVSRYGPGAPAPEGQLMGARLTLLGQEFMVLNGGRPKEYAFSPGISLFVGCKTQREIDNYWEKLSKGGMKMPCGWLSDKFGLTWQVIPEQLGAMLGDEDPEKAGRVMQAMFKMTKLDLAELKAAHRGR